MSDKYSSDIEQILDDFYDGVFIEDMPKAKAKLEALLRRVEVDVLTDLRQYASTHDSMDTTAYAWVKLNLLKQLEKEQ